MLQLILGVAVLLLALGLLAKIAPIVLKLVGVVASVALVLVLAVVVGVPVAVGLGERLSGWHGKRPVCPVDRLCRIWLAERTDPW